jgi:hypothetical protein
MIIEKFPFKLEGKLQHLCLHAYLILNLLFPTGELKRSLPAKRIDDRAGHPAATSGIILYRPHTIERQHLIRASVVRWDQHKSSHLATEVAFGSPLCCHIRHITMRWNLWNLISLFAMSLVAPSSFASDYYFSNTGNDQTGNGSLINPWRSIGKFNTLDLSPADSVYFRAGDTFHGSLSLDQLDSGSDASGNLIAPIAIGSYGGASGSRAVIRSLPNSAALRAINSSGIEIRDLEFENGGSFASNPESGVYFSVDLSVSGDLTHLQHLRFDNIISRGFHRSGLAINASSSVGYEDVQVANSEFYDNQFAGLEVAANLWTEPVHRDFRIDHVIARDNPGFVGCTPHCGHGVVLGQVNGGTIENSSANSNGSAAGKGNVGIWTWQSNNIVIQRNTAIGNRSPLGGDGGGFDIDGGVTNSVVQYNFSQDNAGAGYLVAEFGFAEPMQQNVYRYNRSVNDGMDGYGAFTIWGEDATSIASSALIHNNTAIVDRSIAPGSRGTVWFINENHDNIDLINNVFVALNEAALIDGTTSIDKARFLNNAYWTGGAPIHIEGESYGSIEEWSNASQQERFASQFLGVDGNPNFDGGGYYRPFPPSELIDGGMPANSAAWPTWFTGLGPTDLYGMSVPLANGVDIGAAEYPQLAGDYNNDGVANAADYTVWRDTVGAIGAILDADGNRNGIIDTGDYLLWKSYFANSANGSGRSFASTQFAHVPEPTSTFVVFIVGFASLGSRLRRRY